MKLNDLPHLQQSGFCWSRLTGQKSLRIKPITPVYSVYGDALFMHNALSGHNGNHGRFVRLNKSGIVCWPFSTLVCRCLLWSDSFRKEDPLAFYAKSCRRKPLLGPFPNAHCFNGCQRESNETSLTKAVTAWSDAAERASQWADLYPHLGPSNAMFAPRRATRSPQPAGDSFKQSDPAPPQDCVFPGSHSAVT